MMGQLAQTYLEAGKVEQAVPLLEQALPIVRAKLRPDHPNRLEMIDNLAEAYRATGKLDQALPLFEEAIRLSQELLTTQRRQPVEDIELAETLAQLGRYLLHSQQPVAAEPPLRESLTLRQKTHPDAWTTFNTQSMLGGALLGQKKYADAKPLLLAGYEGMVQREPGIPSQRKLRLMEALERLVQLYDAWDKKDKADEWRKKGEAVKAKKPNAKP